MFNIRLQKLRRDRGFSQEKLAELLGVSRQALSKWELGEAIPEVENLLAISTLFLVSLDFLLKEPEPCTVAPPTSVRTTNHSQIEFLLRAKKATYAGHGAEALASWPESHDLAYAEGELSYHDTYVGSEQFAGQEGMWHNGAPFWAMNYAGRVTGGPFSGDFLKEALTHGTVELPFRGPLLFQNGDYSYHSKVSGEFSWFQGNEEIFYRNERIYECTFQGGLII